MHIMQKQQKNYRSSLDLSSKNQLKKAVTCFEDGIGDAFDHFCVSARI